MWRSGVNEITSRKMEGYNTDIIEFFTLSRSCDVSQLDSLIEEGLNINRPMSLEDGRRPLHAAAAKGNVHMVDELLKRGANIDIRDYLGNTPLHEASRERHEEVLRLLLAKKAEVDLRNDKGYTALEYAVTLVDVVLVKVLLSEGANVHAGLCADSLSDFTGLPKYNFTGEETVLSFAFWLEHLQFINIFLKAGTSLQKESGTLMYFAIKKHNIMLIKLLLENRINIETKVPEGPTPLDAAVNFGSFQVVELLVNKGAKLETGSSLKLALENGNLDIVELLIRKGSKLSLDTIQSAMEHALIEGDHIIAKRLFNESMNKVCVSTDCYSKCLQEAVNKGNVDMIRLIIDKITNVNVKFGDDKSTALILATQKSLAPVIELLLQKGANMRLTDKYGCSALYYAIEANDSPDIFDIFLKRGAAVDENLNDLSNVKALHLAVRSRRTRVVEYLLEKGANANAKDAYGNTPYHELFNIAYSFEDITQLAKLLEKGGANLYCSNDDGAVPVFLAIRERNWFVRTSETDLVRLFLEECFKVNEYSVQFIEPLLQLVISRGHIELVKLVLSKVVRYYVKEAVLSNSVTCLQFASYKGDMKMLDFGLQCGMSIDHATKERFTPLQIALYSDNIQLAHQLINRGSNLRIEDTHGLRPIQVAFLLGDPDLIEHFYTKTIFNNNTVFMIPILHLAASHGNIYLVKSLLSKGCSLDSKDENGNTILHISVEIQNHELVVFLLENGIDKNAQNKAGDTAFHIALRFLRHFNLCLEIAETLMKSGVDINIENEKKDTPIHLASSTPLLSFLLEKRVKDINARNIKGKTPLYCLANHLQFMGSAISFDPTERVIMMLRHGAKVNSKSNEGKYLLSVLLRCKALDIKKIGQEWKIDMDILDVDEVECVFATLNYDQNRQDAFKRQFDFIRELLNQGFAFETLTDDENSKFLNELMEDRNFYILQLILMDERTMMRLNVVLSKAMQETKLNIIKLVLDRLDVNTSYDYDISIFFPKEKQMHGLAQIFYDRVKITSTVSNCLPLVHLAKSGSTSAVKYLLCKGAYVNSVDVEGNTPLNAAISSGYGKLVYLLIMWSADVNILNKRGESPVHIAAKVKDVNVLKAVLVRDSRCSTVDNDGNTPLHLITSYDVAQILINKGVPINAQNSLRRTALHCIFGSSLPERQTVPPNDSSNDSSKLATIAALLIERGVVVNIQDKFGMTALHLAAKKSDVVAMAVLVDNKAKLDLRDHKGQTALHHAVINFRHHIIEYLLTEGASPDVRDKRGKSPYRMCCSGHSIQSKPLFDRYLVKEKLAGLPNRSYLHGTLTSDEEVACLGELERMKQAKIDEMFCLFDIFASFRNPKYLSDEKRVRTLEELFSAGLLDQFPNYKGILKCALNKSKRRWYLIHLAIDFMYDETRDLIFGTLSSDVWFHVLTFLSVDDISMVICSITNRFY